MAADGPTGGVKRGGLAAKLLLSLCALLVPVLVLEGGARLLLPPPPPNAFPGLSPGETEDEDLLWRNRAGYAADDKHGPINALGLRGPEISEEKPPGTRRILSLGESTTFGSQLRWDETYSHRLEELLREAGRPVEVLNGAVRAWSTVQSTRFLELEIDSLAPDAVLFYHEVNDFWPTTFRGVRMQGAGLTDAQMMAASRSWLRRLRLRSRLLSSLGLAWARAHADRSLRELGEKSGVDVLMVQSLPYRELTDRATSGEFRDSGDQLPWMENPNRLVRVPDPDRERSLRELAALTRSRSVALVLLHPAYAVSRPHRCVLTRIAREEQIPVLEIEEVLAEDARRSGRRRRDYFHPGDPFHPNALGHQVFARGISDFLIRTGLAASPDWGRGEGTFWLAASDLSPQGRDAGSKQARRRPRRRALVPARSAQLATSSPRSR